MEQITEILKVDAFVSVIETAPAILTANQASVKNALEFGEKLLATITEQGMSDEMDTRCNAFLVKVKATCTAMNEKRKPITSLFDDVKKAFTSQEAQIDQKSDIYTKIQKFRNDYAAEKIRKQQEAERVAQRRLAIDKEKIAVKAVIETGISKHVSDYITKKQQELLSLFEGATLENFDEVSGQIKLFPVDYPHEHFITYQAPVNMIYLTTDDVVLIIREISDDKYVQLSDEYRNTIFNLRQAFIDKLPSKKQELEAMAKANAEEAKRLQDEAEKRKKEDADRLAKEQAERDAKAAAAAETNKQVSTANSVFNAQMEVAQVATPSAPVRSGFNIIVKNPIGYLAIVSFYFEKEGNKATVEGLEKKTLGAMKTFCESHAKSTGELINNPFLEYKEVFKAIAKK